VENIRIKFSKTGDAKYISHLDLNRFFQRSFKRSGVPIWVTEGFNPHIYLHFLLPLSLGSESISEYVDLKIYEHMEYEEIVKRLNAVLPNGFEILSAAAPINKPVEIDSCRYELIFEETEMCEVENFLNESEIKALKKTKRQEYFVDLKEEMRDVSLSEKDSKPTLSVTLSAIETHMINPELIARAFSSFSGRDVYIRITRTAVFKKDGKDFE
jgi:radical SAM-linked protein